MVNMFCRLIHDRELTLFDGTRLLRQDKYDAIKEEQGLSDQEMADTNILPIHPSFRILALSEPPVIGSSSQQWLSSEVVTMFLYHNMRSMTQSEEMQVLKRLVPNMADMRPVMELTHKLRHATDSNVSVSQCFNYYSCCPTLLLYNTKDTLSLTIHASFGTIDLLSTFIMGDRYLHSRFNIFS